MAGRYGERAHRTGNSYDGRSSGRQFQGLGDSGVPDALREQARTGIMVTVAGIVINRQHPPTARGYTFLSLEDETGLVNVIIRPPVFTRYQRAILDSPVIMVVGELQDEHGAVQVMAHTCTARHVRLAGRTALPRLAVSREQGFVRSADNPETTANASAPPAKPAPAACRPATPPAATPDAEVPKASEVLAGVRVRQINTKTHARNAGMRNGDLDQPAKCLADQMRVSAQITTVSAILNASAYSCSDTGSAMPGYRVAVAKGLSFSAWRIASGTVSPVSSSNVSTDPRHARRESPRRAPTTGT